MCQNFPWEIKSSFSSWGNRPSLSYAVHCPGSDYHSPAWIQSLLEDCGEGNLKRPLLKPQQVASHSIFYIFGRIETQELRNMRNPKGQKKMRVRTLSVVKCNKQARVASLDLGSPITTDFLCFLKSSQVFNETFSAQTFGSSHFFRLSPCKVQVVKGRVVLHVMFNLALDSMTHVG